VVDVVAVPGTVVAVLAPVLVPELPRATEVGAVEGAMAMIKA
jgi:hypothetical protein